MSHENVMSKMQFSVALAERPARHIRPSTSHVLNRNGLLQPHVPDSLARVFLKTTADCTEIDPQSKHQIMLLLSAASDHSQNPSRSRLLSCFRTYMKAIETNGTFRRNSGGCRKSLLRTSESLTDSHRGRFKAGPNRSPHVPMVYEPAPRPRLESFLRRSRYSSVIRAGSESCERRRREGRRGSAAKVVVVRNGEAMGPTVAGGCKRGSEAGLNKTYERALLRASMTEKELSPHKEWTLARDAERPREKEFGYTQSQCRKKKATTTKAYYRIYSQGAVSVRK